MEPAEKSNLNIGWRTTELIMDRYLTRLCYVDTARGHEMTDTVCDVGLSFLPSLPHTRVCFSDGRLWWSCFSRRLRFRREAAPLSVHASTHSHPSSTPSSVPGADRPAGIRLLLPLVFHASCSYRPRCLKASSSWENTHTAASPRVWHVHQAEHLCWMPLVRRERHVVPHEKERFIFLFWFCVFLLLWCLPVFVCCQPKCG